MAQDGDGIVRIGLGGLPWSGVGSRRRKDSLKFRQQEKLQSGWEQLLRPRGWGINGIKIIVIRGRMVEGVA